MSARISIDNLIEIVRTGGKVKTGVDVYNSKGVLLLDGNVIVTKARLLEIVKDNGIKSVAVNTTLDGGLWDARGNQITISDEGMVDIHAQVSGPVTVRMQANSGRTRVYPDIAANEIQTRLIKIEEIKRQAAQKYEEARNSIKKVLLDIKNTGGQFDFDEVSKNVADLVDFLVEAGHPFSYLTQEIFSYDDYLYNHSINVCAIGTAILYRFNTHFSQVVDDLIKGNTSDIYNPFEIDDNRQPKSFICYYEDELFDISLGFFLHDIGKIMVADEILNKQEKMTRTEYSEVKKHSYEYGVDLLDKNHLENSVIRNIIKYHHAPLYDGEQRCYPADRPYDKIPLYTRICKLADIYDAMTSKRSYREAVNPINVVTQVFRSYASKDQMLQYILHAFVKSMGIYPPGSIIYLKNGQMAYVIESDGPIVIPFTDEKENTLSAKPEPIDISSEKTDENVKVDNQRSVRTPVDVYDLLPHYIKAITVRP